MKSAFAMRIRLSLGDIIAEGRDIFGDGVNIAALLEALAEPGSILVSEIAYHHVADKFDFAFEDLGPHNLKNIRRPIRVYRMGGGQKIDDENLATADAPISVSPTDFDDRRAIAVLPFANFSGDLEEFFADASPKTSLRCLRGWRVFPVIAHNSTFNYKGQNRRRKKGRRGTGRALCRRRQVRKSGHRVRVTVQLIRADTDHHIAAERYDRDRIDLFELQDEIVTTIAGAIDPEILKFERSASLSAEHNADAY
jgi:adenylate cyclase